MKKSLFAIVSILMFQIGHADDTEMSKTLEEAKKHHLEMIESRQSSLNEAKTCINAATTKEAVMECHKKLKHENHDMKMKHMEHKKERLENHMEKMKK